MNRANAAQITPVKPQMTNSAVYSKYRGPYSRPAWPTSIRIALSALFLFFAFPTLATYSGGSQVLYCDVDLNNSIDRSDIDLIRAAKGTFADGPQDPRDPDRNGKIRQRDVRICKWRCDNAFCAPNPTGGTMQCDLEGDNDVDRRDIWLIRNRFGQHATGPDDVADADGNGRINRKDSRLCRQQCTLPHCAVVHPDQNTKPVANAGPDQAVVLGALVQLDGSGSSDADGDTLSYAWQLTTSPAGSNAQLSNSHTVNPTLQPDVVGTYSVKLLVSDASLTSEIDRVEITVTSQDVAVPNVVGETQADAEAELAAVALEVGQITTMPSASVPAGSVIDQAPVGGTLVAPGSSVDLLISTGAANQPPTADAGADQSAAVNTLITLDASGSTDADGGTLTYAWVLTAPANSNAALSAATAINPTFTLDLPGQYLATLTVSDGALSATDSVAVNTVNSAPVANAGADQATFTGSTVTFDGSASSDIDGDPLTFQWAIESAPANSSSNLANANSPMPTLEIDVAGSWSIRLAVNDGTINSTADFVVVSTDNTAPVADAGANQTATVGGTVTLDGSGSTDVDADPLTYRWSFTSTPAGSSAALQQPLTPMPMFVLDAPGTYTAQLVVNDGAVDSAPAIVTIETINTAPVAEAGPDQTPFVGEVVSLDGSASSDVDGDVLTYRWSLTSLPANSTATLSATDSAQPEFTVDVAGTYVAQLIVNDATIDSTPDTVIIDTANSAPVADAGANQSGLAGDLITLDGSGSTDIDGDPLTYAWSLETTPLGSNAQLNNADQPNPAFVLDTAGIYIAQLIVSDGALSSAPATVTINTNNTPPVAAIVVTGEPAFVGSELTFSGLTSSDADADPLTYEWSLLSAPTNSQSALDSPTAATTALVMDISGDYTVQLQVNDGTTTSAPETVTVSTGNSRPTASASASTSGGFAGDIITFSGQASTDPDNDPLNYSWSLLSAPQNNTAALSDTTSAAPELVTDIAGTYVAQLIVSDGSLDSDPATAMATVESLPMVSVDDIAVEEGDTGTVSAVFTVTLSKPISESVVVSYATSDGTATEGSDYTSNSGTVNFPANVTEQPVLIEIIGDTDFEPDEDFVLTLTNPVRAVLGDASGTGTISNNDFIGSLSLSADASTLLTFDTANFTVTSSIAAPSGGLAVTLGGPDSLTLPLSVTIPEGATSANFGATAGSESVSGDVIAEATSFEEATSAVTVTLRTLALTLDFPLVGINEEDPGTIALTDPAPAAGVAITLESVDPAIASVAPALVNIAGGAQSGSFTLTGVSAGFSQITASAPGYVTENLGYESTNKILSIAQGIELPLQRSISYPVTIAPEVAPPGGLLVTLTSSNSDVVLTPTELLIPEGANSANSQVIANGFNSSTIRVTATGFAGDSGTVAAVAELRIPQNSVTFSEGFPSSFDINLIADGASAVAPTGGLPITLIAADPTCVDVPATQTLLQDLSSVEIALDYAGTATLPCSTSVSVTSLDQIVGDSVNVTVNEALPISLSTVRDVGKNLTHRTGTPRLTLSERFHGGVTVRVQSNNPDKLLVARSSTLAGAAFQEFFLADGDNSEFFFLQGLNHSDPDTSASYTVSAEGFADTTATINVVDPSLNINSLSTSVIVFSTDRAGSVSPGVLNGNSFDRQSVRPGAPALAVTVTTDDASIVTLVDAGTPTATLTSSVAPGTSVAVPTIRVRGLALGTATVTATAPNYIPASQPVEAIGPSQSFSLGDGFAGEGLQPISSHSVILGGSNHGGVTVRVTSSDPTVTLVSADSDLQGSAFVDIPVADGRNRAFFTLQGVSVGEITLSATTPGFADGSATYRTVPTGLRLQSINATIDTLDADDAFSLDLTAIGPGNTLRTQEVRAGGSSITATVGISDPAVAVASTSAASGAAQQTVVFDPGQRTVAFALQPLSVGAVTVSASATANGFSVQPASPVPVTVTAPTVDNSVIPNTVGAGLQVFLVGSTRPRVQLSAASHGGVTATLTSSDPSVLRFSADPSTAGTASIDLVYADGEVSKNYLLHGIAPGTATVTFSVPGFTTPVDRTVTVVTPDLALAGLPSTIDTLDPDVRLSARTQSAVRIGGGPLTVTATNSQPGIGTLVVDGNDAQSQTITIAEGDATSPNSGNPPVGGLQFRPLSTGATTVTLSAAGFNSASADTVVTTPSITMPAGLISIGTGLRNTQGFRVTLGASDHGGITGELCSTSASIALVALTATDVGSLCVSIDFDPGQTVKGFYVHGVGTGSVNLQMSAPGFLEASKQATVETAFVSTLSLTDTVSLTGGDRTFTARVGVLSSSGNLSPQIVNATAGAIALTVTSSDGAVGELVTGGSNGPAVQIQVLAGSNNQTLAFRPLATGSTTVEVSGAGLGQATGAVRTVSVTP